MKLFLGFLKNISALFLGIIVCIFIVIYTFLNTTKELLSKDNIINTVKNVDIVEFIGEDTKQELYRVLEKTEIPTEYIDVMLEDQHLKETVGSYVASSLDFLLSDKEVPKIDENEVTNVLITSFDKVIEEAEKHQIEVQTYISKEKQDKIHEKIEYYVPEVIAQIPVAEEFIKDKINENSDLVEAKRQIEQVEQLIDNIQMVYSYKDILLIVILILMMLIVAIKFKEFKFIKWLIFPLILSASILKFVCVVVPYLMDNYMPSELVKLNSIINPSIQTLLSGINSAVIICFIISICLFIVQIVICLYKRRQEKIVL